MNLYAPLIRWIVFRGRRIRLNTSFRTVLRCYEAFQDDLLSNFEKIDLCLSLLVKGRALRRRLAPQGRIGLFECIFHEFIDTSGKKGSEGKKAFDFTQDAGLIYAAFRQCYHIDLTGKDKNLHWWNFVALFNGLPDDTKLMQIISVRTRPLPKPTKYNQEQRRQLMQMKQRYRLEVSEEEEKRQYQQGLAQIAMTLQNLAQRP